MKRRLIVIDGKTYKSVDEMPPDVRAKYEQAMGSFKDQNQNQMPDAFESSNPLADKDNNGVPDVFENAFSVGNIMSSMKIIVDGKEVNSINDLPPEARAKYDRAMGHLDANQNGVPDFMEGMVNTSTPTSTVSTGFEAPRPPRSQSITNSPSIAPDTSNGWMLALLGTVLLMACVLGAAGILYFFYR